MGNIDIPNNPKGLKPGDSVYFINIECGNFCMWGIFVEYNEVDNEYRIEWGDQCLMSDGLDYGFIPAGHDYVKPENIL